MPAETGRNVAVQAESWIQTKARFTLLSLMCQPVKNRQDRLVCVYWHCAVRDPSFLEEVTSVNKQEKTQKVEHWHEVFAGAEAAVFTGVSGLTVTQATELRKRFRDANVQYEVVKNTLARRALKDTPMDVAIDIINGPTAVAWSNEDPAAAARVAMDFAKIKENAKFEIRGGYVGGRALDAQGVEALSTMPTFEELRAQILGAINAVPAKLLAQINAPGQHVVGVLQARKEDMEKAA